MLFATVSSFSEMLSSWALKKHVTKSYRGQKGLEGESANMFLYQEN